MTNVTIHDATLYLGDCREILPTLPHDKVIVMDPPYGIQHRSDYVAETTTAEWMEKEIQNDSDASLRDAVLSDHGSAWCSFGSWKVARPNGTRAVLVWDKGPASGMGDLSFPWKASWEEIYIGGDGWSGRRDEGVIKGRWIVTRKSMGRLHPNEKPVSLMSHIITKAPPGVVVDPFMGSGTTGVASANLGRKFIGIEIERKYFDIAVERITAAYAQQRLFA